MSLRSRLDKIAELTDLAQWNDCRPHDTDVATWGAIGQKLVELPAFAFHPWKDVPDVVRWLAAVRPETLLDCPEPVLQASMAVEAEAAGEPFEPVDFATMTDEELRAIVDQEAAC